MITNEHIADLIDAYVAGGLSGAERSRVEMHVAVCTSCAALLEEARKNDAELNALFASVRPGEGFEDQLIGAVRVAPDNRRSRFLLHPMARRLVSGIAAALVLGTVGFVAGDALKNQKLPLMRNGPQLALNGKTPHERTPGQPSAYGSRVDVVDTSGSTAVARGESEVRAKLDDTEVTLTKTPASQIDSLRTEVEELGKQTNDYSLMSLSDRTREEVRERTEGREGKGEKLAERYKESAESAGVADAKQGQKPDATRAIRVGVDGAETEGEARWGLITGKDLGRPKGAETAAGETITQYWYRESAGERTGRTSTIADPAAAAKGMTSGGRPALVDGETAGRKHTEEFGYHPAKPGEPQAGDSAPAGAPNGWATAPFAAPGHYDRFVRDSRSSGETQGVVAGRPVTSLGSEVKDGKKDKELSDTLTTGGTALAGAQPPRFPDSPELNLQSNTSGGVGGSGGGGAGGGSGSGGTQLGFGVVSKSNNEGKQAGKPASSPEDGKLLAGLIVDGTTPASGAEPSNGEPKRPAADDSIVAADPIQPGGDEKKPANKPADGDRRAGDTAAGVTGASSDGPAGESAPSKPASRTPPGTATPEAADPAPVAADPAPAATDPAPKPPPPQIQNAAERKIIRNGSMTFEVDGFDSAAIQIAKIAAEEGGFIATTDSEKLPNGKVKGTIIVRVPPDRLDTLVLKLRGMGDLRSQKITAQDVTKQYTDIDSQLKAGRAMEARFIEIIKTGKGEIKDLIEAEKQLGVWREKIEMLEGEIRYLNNLVSFSTLAVTLMERDIKTPTAAFEQEEVQMGIETEDVEKARAEALQAIDQAKGRVFASDLRKEEGGRLSSTIVAEVAPDAAGPLTDRFKQLGTVARFDVDRKTTTQGGVGPIMPQLKVERRNTRFQVNLYNLAKVQPRRSTALSIAAADVEQVYRGILDQVRSAGGQIGSSQLNRPRGNQPTGTIQFHIATDKADVVLAAIRAGVEVMQLDVTQSQDLANTTEAKQGFTVQVLSLASVDPRETTSLQIASSEVPEAYNRLLEAVQAAGGRVLESQLSNQDTNNVAGVLAFDVTRDKYAAIDAALRPAGIVVSRNVQRSPDHASTVDSKVRLRIELYDTIRLTPRESFTIVIATRNVAESFNKALESARAAGAKVLGSQLHQNDPRKVFGEMTVHVPTEAWPQVETALKEAGIELSRIRSYAQDGPRTVSTKIGLNVWIGDQRELAAREEVSMHVVVPDVRARYNAMVEMLARLDAQIHESRFDESNRQKLVGVLKFTIQQQDRSNIEQAMTQGADVFNRSLKRNQEVRYSEERLYKVTYEVQLLDAGQQGPRQVYETAIESPTVAQSVTDIEAAAIARGGRKADSSLDTVDGVDKGMIVLDVPLAQAGPMLQEIRNEAQRVVSTTMVRNDQVAEGSLSRARIKVTLSTPPKAAEIVGADQGVWASIRDGLRTGVQGLLTSLTWIVVGLCLIGPFLLLAWAIWKMWRKSRRDSRTTPPGATPTTA